VSTRVEVGRDPPFQGFQMKFLQAVSLSSERSLAGEVRQRRPSPLLQGSPVQGRRLVGARVGGLRFVNERLEAVGIQLTRSDAQHVSGRPPFEPVGAEHPAKVRHVALEGLAGGVRRVVSPYLVDQVLGGHDVVRMEKEAR